MTIYTSERRKKENGYKILYVIDSINVKAQLLFLALIFFFLFIMFVNDDQMMLFLEELRLALLLIMTVLKSIYK